MQRLLFLLFFVCFGHAGSAQAIVAGDTSAVVIRNFAAGKINEYRANPDFSYERLAEPPKSLWDRFWDWFWQKMEEFFGKGGTSYFIKVVLIVIAIAVLVFFIFKLSGMTNVGLFGKDNKSADLPYILLNDDIHAIQFDAAIQQAVDDRNFRFAVRLLYLQVLKYLADRELVSWQVNKTNEAYVHELAGSQLQQEFRHLTRQFENNWYGDVPIAENEFGMVREQFNQFNRQLK